MVPQMGRDNGMNNNGAATKADYQKYKLGGESLKVENFFKNTGLALADTGLGAIGLSNVVKDSDYVGPKAKSFNQVGTTMGNVTNKALPIAANFIVPGSGAAISAGQKAIGGFNPQDPSQFDEYGNPKDKDLYNVNQGINMVGNLAGQAQGMGLFAMGGMNKYPGGGMGIGNGQVELDENSVAPNGQFTQFNEAPHSQQNPNVPNASLAPGEKIFSDRLKVPGTKKTFAELNKINNTNKEDKLEAKGNLSKESLNSIAKNRLGKRVNSEVLFNAQEALKQAKVEAYAKKMGYELPQVPQIPQQEFAMGGEFSRMNTLPKYDWGGMNKKNSLPENSSLQFNNKLDFSKYGINSHNFNLEQPNNDDLRRQTFGTRSSNINNNDVYDTNINTENFDWGNAISNASNFIGQNAGNIYDLTRKNEPLETYERASAKYLDPTAAERDAEAEARRTAFGLANASGGQAGKYLANRVALNAQNVINKDRIRKEYANANAQIGNQNAQFNAEIAYREAVARAANAAMKENVKSNAMHNISSNFGKMTKSNAQDMMQNKEYELYAERYKNEPAFRAMLDRLFKKNSKTFTK